MHRTGTNETALSEIRNGRKRSHWIWYIFPQIKGLGMSGTSEFYGIDGLDEAIAYMDHPVLRERLIEISQALLDLNSDNATEILGRPDDMKVRSSMTLFMKAAPEELVFEKVLDKFYGGLPDLTTLELLER